MVEQVGESNIVEVQAFLAGQEECSQFLINNLGEHGPSLVEHQNSGNFKAIRLGGEIRAVFCLTRRGNLIMQGGGINPEVVLDACSREPIHMKGFIGEWDSIEPVYSLFKKQTPSFIPSFESKEILFSYPLSVNELKLRHDARVRLLTPADFSRWFELRAAYLSELGLPSDGVVDLVRGDFDAQVVGQRWWGLFEGNELLSQVGLNSKGETVGQVGGVFTPEPYRKRGLAKAAMVHMLRDCRDIHGHTKSILFTGETDIAAQKLYESIGYNRIGFFAMMFGK